MGPLVTYTAISGGGVPGGGWVGAGVVWGSISFPRKLEASCGIQMPTFLFKLAVHVILALLVITMRPYDETQAIRRKGKQ